MIPYAILSGNLTFEEGNVLAIRVLDLSVDTFSFRLAKRYAGSKIVAIDLRFYSFTLAAFRDVHLGTGDFLVKRAQAFYDTESSEDVRLAEKFFDLFQVTVNSPLFEAYALALSKEYLNYVRLKNAGDVGEMSESLVGYPANKDAEFVTSVDQFREICFGKVENFIAEALKTKKRLNGQSGDIQKYVPDYALDVNSPALMQQFVDLSWDEFLNEVEDVYYLGKLSFSQSIDIHTIYLGNQFSFDSFPAPLLLEKAIEKAKQLGLKIVIATPPLKDRELSMIKKLLLSLAENLKNNSQTEEGIYDFNYDSSYNSSYNSKTYELVINDWGLLEYVSKTYPDSFDLTLGILLNKRRKDVRLPYKNGKDMQLEALKENSSNAAFFREELLKRYKLRKFSYESCEYPFDMAGEGHILHLPYYQMNTGGSKANWTSEYVFYPKHLHMIGAQETLFGFDGRILTDADYLQSFLRQNPSRVVFEIL